MTLQESFDFLNFWINKRLGAWYTIPELEQLCDRGQMAYYSDVKSKYATSQLVKDTLSPFRDTYNFTTAVSGYVIVPTDRNYLDLLDIQVFFQISDRTVYAPVRIVNEDERAERLNSQIDPVTATSPIGEQYAPGTFRLYPATAHNGTITFLRRPVKPVFSYTILSGRVIVFNEGASTNLEWRETDIVPVLLKALQSVGINLSAADVAQFAELKTQQNFQSVNRL
jgi:hypothetical protein